MSELKKEFEQDYEKHLKGELPQSIIEHYRIIRCLSSKTNKSTYLLQEKVTQQYFILKQAEHELKVTLEEEYIFLKKVNHQAIPTVTAFLEEGDKKYLIRPYVEGKTLEEWVGEWGSFRKQEVKKIMLQLCDVVAYLHRQTPSIIHRDIKPQNIIYTASGQIRLIDFDIARFEKEDALRDTICMGTLGTAAPEQFGYGQSTKQTDIYALGMMMFFLLTGSLYIQHLGDYQINECYRKIIQKCTQFDPKRRFQTVEALTARIKCDKRSNYLKIIYNGLIALLIFSIGSGSQYAYLYYTSLERPVYFKEFLIEKAVRHMLNKQVGEVVTYRDLEKIEKLYLCGEIIYDSWDQHFTCGEIQYIDGVEVETIGPIRSLQDLKKMPNLKELAVYNQQITTLQPIKDLPIEKLGVGGNFLKDIQGIKELKHLKCLNITHNAIASLEGIEKLEALESIDISGTRIEQLEPLKSLPINELSFIDGKLDDYSVFTSFSELETLRLSQLTYEEVKVISHLKQLKALTLYHSEVRDIGVLSEMKELTQLDVYGCKIEELSGVKKLPTLTKLGIGDHDWPNLEPLTYLPNLEEMDLNNAQIEDWRALKYIPKLHIIYGNEVHREPILAHSKENQITFYVD